MSPDITLHLPPAAFAARERTLVECGPLVASTFCFDSGVRALRLRNEIGDLVILPYQGQQIWSAVFGGRDLRMRSLVREPIPTGDFLAAFGAFMVHCGLAGTGGPGPGDTHPLHGELPNAVYGAARLVVGSDAHGPFIAATGDYRHTVAFSQDYLAQPTVRLYPGSTLFELDMKITNLKHSPMELLYLAHINFLPVDTGRMVYSAQPTAEHTRVRQSIPSHIKPAAGYAEFVQELALEPSKADVLKPGLAFDPEIVFMLDYVADTEGWAHTMQVHPDGSADYVGHRPDQLPHGTRWMCRTPDMDALGFEPGTAEPEGYSREKAKGNVLTLLPGGTMEANMTIGALAPAASGQIEDKIRRSLGQR